MPVLRRRKYLSVLSYMLVMCNIKLFSMYIVGNFHTQSIIIEFLCILIIVGNNILISLIFLYLLNLFKLFCPRFFLLLTRDAQRYIVLPIYYCTIYYIFQHNIIDCKAKKYCPFIYMLAIYCMSVNLCDVQENLTAEGNRDSSRIAM